MAYSIWREMSGSGAGIGMGHLMLVALIREALRQAPTVCFGAAVGAPTRSAVGRRFATRTATRRLATTASASAPSSPQVGEPQHSLPMSSGAPRVITCFYRLFMIAMNITEL